MCFHLTSAVLRSADLPPGPKLVLAILADHVPSNGFECFIGQPRIATESGMSERVVRDHLATLEARGYIERTRRQRADGTRLPDGYRLHFHSEPADSAASEGVIRNRQISQDEPPDSADRVIGEKRGSHSEPADSANPHMYEASNYEARKTKSTGTASPRLVDQPTEDATMTPHRNAEPLPAWLPPSAWREWQAHRGRKLTPEAQRRQVAKLDALRREGYDPAQVIGLAIESGWATFYPPRRNPVGRKSDRRTAFAHEIFGATPNGQHDEAPEPRVIDGEAERLG